MAGSSNPDLLVTMAGSSNSFLQTKALTFSIWDDSKAETVHPSAGPVDPGQAGAKRGVRPSVGLVDPDQQGLAMAAAAKRVVRPSACPVDPVQRGLAMAAAAKRGVKRQAVAAVMGKYTTLTTISRSTLATITNTTRQQESQEECQPVHKLVNIL